jgi:hypothetical protein
MSAALQNQLLTMPPLTDDLVEILGRPSFDCIRIAQALRLGGHEIKSKAEHEQAHAIHYLLNQYFLHGSNWVEKTNIALKDMVADAKAAKTNGPAKKRITGKRHITFPAPMILSLLDGRKTQTRERIDPAPQMITGKRSAPWEGDPAALMQLLEQSGKRCPYGQPGDRIWVREAWAHDAETLDQCRASLEDAMGSRSYGPYYRATESAPDTLRWRPSIQMPRWASRILLEIVSVRVERLTDISEADAIAEGVEFRPSPFSGLRPNWRDYQAPAGSNWEWTDRPRKSFMSLWRLLEGPCIELTNPWVWVIEFKRVQE